MWLYNKWQLQNEWIPPINALVTQRRAGAVSAIRSSDSILALSPYTYCVTLDKLISFSVSKISYLLNLSF